MTLWRAHPDIFDDALLAVISKARERDHEAESQSAGPGFEFLAMHPF